MILTVDNLQTDLDRIGRAVGAKLTLKLSDKGYYVQIDDNPIALTSGWNLYGLHGYIDGLRDMYPLMKYGNVPE